MVPQHAVGLEELLLHSLHRNRSITAFFPPCGRCTDRTISVVVFESVQVVKLFGQPILEGRELGLTDDILLIRRCSKIARGFAAGCTVSKVLAVGLSVSKSAGRGVATDMAIHPSSTAPSASSPARPLS